jgi:hypothetical protein
MTEKVTHYPFLLISSPLNNVSVMIFTFAQLHFFCSFQKKLPFLNTKYFLEHFVTVNDWNCCDYYQIKLTITCKVTQVNG